MPREYWFLARRTHSLYPRSLNRYVKLRQDVVLSTIVSTVMFICISILLPIFISTNCVLIITLSAFCIILSYQPLIPTAYADISAQVLKTLCIFFVFHPIIQLPSHSSHHLLNQWYLGRLRPQFTIVWKCLGI